MEMSRNEHMRPFQANPGNVIHQTNVSSIGIQPLLGKSWKSSVVFKNQQFSSIGLELTKKILPTSAQTLRPKYRDPHPYRKKQLLQCANSKKITDNIPPLVSTNNENGPKPLIPHEILENLTRLRYSCNKANHNTNGWSYKNKLDSPNTSYINESTKVNEYIRNEKSTKQKIDEIIYVAQALRAKIKREEEKRHISGLAGSTRDCNYDQSFSQSQILKPTDPIIMRTLKATKPISNSVVNGIPRLMDLKPKIPNLMDLYITPPDIENVIQENIMVAKNRYDAESGSLDKCWNCDRIGHRFIVCKSSKIKKFCFRCGKSGFDVSSCPYCKVWGITKP